MKKYFALSLVAISAVLASGAAMANDTIKAVNNKVGLSYTAGTSFEYSKTDTDGLTSGEKDGSQNGFTLSASTQRDVFGVSDVFLAADVTYMAGDTKYHGYALDDGNWVPATGKTDYDSLDFALKIGKGFAVAPAAQITPYLTVGTRKWDRDQTAEGSYLEKHSNSFWGVGALFQYAVDTKLVLSAEASYALNNSSKVNWVTGGDIYEMDNKGTTKLGFGATYRVTPQLSVFADYAWTQTKFGTSPIVNGYAEPASTTKTQRVNVGVAYNF